ncbi:hypothetical protein DXT88_13840 [Herbaspirillum lusitanum]|uniref:hypothetical protein n=1 Tax=Herbaspirillum lusitanum TaxID=213312 RepID=UPI00223869CC|nr:hypothetical protein [Herbaspirillum lusitanum]MCW5299258.1 hypothetical protein [Herbaspirillum lusitanum]
MQPLPKTIANSLIQELVEKVSRSRYFLEEDFAWHQMVRKARPLQSERRYQWDGVMGLLYTYVMRFDEAESCLRNSLALHGSDVPVLNLMQGLIEAGRFLKAQEHFSSYGRPNRGSFTILLPLALECCAFRVLSSYIDEAEKMNLEIPDIHTPLRSVIRLLDQHGISDQDIAAHMEAAAEVLRRRRIRVVLKRSLAGSEQAPELFTVCFVVPLEPAEIFKMNIELAELEDELQIKKSLVFDVAFVQANKSDVYTDGSAVSFAEEE